MLDPLKNGPTSYSQTYEEDVDMHDDIPHELINPNLLKKCAFCNLVASEDKCLLGPYRYKASPDHSERRNL